MKKITFVILTFFILSSLPAYAGMKEIVKYKGAFPDAKPKCIDCHVDKMPKKDDGQHELNDYGKAVVKAAGSNPSSVDTYRSIGTIEDFANKATTK